MRKESRQPCADYTLPSYFDLPNVHLTRRYQPVNSRSITVMGPDDTSSGQPGINPIHPPKFLTNKTNKKEYRDSIRAWIQMMNSFAQADSKYRAHVQGAGHLIFMMCDMTSKEILKQAETDGKLTLKGNESDPTRTALVESIVEVLATESPTEAVRHEVDILSDIVACVRRKDEAPREFATRFRGVIARYVNATKMLSPPVSRQFAVMMLRNAELSSDTMNAIMFQLSSLGKPTSNTVIEIKLSAEEMKRWVMENHSDSENIEKEMVSSVKKAIKNGENNNKVDFTLEDAAAAISQAIVEKKTIDITGYLGYREINRQDRIRRMKENSECKICGKRGHWWTDNEECRMEMSKKRRKINDGWDQRNKGRDRKEDEDKNPRTYSLFASSNTMKHRVRTLRDVNPMMDEGAPTSIGGLNNAARLSDALGMPLQLSQPKSVYRHGWGDGCADPKTVVATWHLRTSDMNGKPTIIPFDIVEGESPLILGLDVKRFADTINLAQPSILKIKRPSDKAERHFHTYLDKDINGNLRTWVEIAHHPKLSVNSLMSSVDKHRTLNIVKKLHRFSHASSSDMACLLESAGYKDNNLKDICERVYNSCDICASSGRPSHMRKISVSHVNEAFNEELQADFLVAYIRGERVDILNMVDTGTGYGERMIVPSRNAGVMKNMMETRWFCAHGAPKRFSADPEFCVPVLKSFLNAHNIHLADRPARSSNKNGIVERNNGIFKLVLSKIAKEKTDAHPQTLTARASLLTNLIHGSGVLSAFELAKGYTPSILGIPARHIPEDVMKAHVEISANRALQKVLKSRVPRVVPPSMLHTGREIWVFYKSSQQNIPVGWVSATVVEPRPHYVLCRRSDKGRPMKVAYEHIRIKPSGDLADELMRHNLDAELCNIQITEDEFEDDDPRDYLAETLAEIFGPDEPEDLEENVVHEDNGTKEDDNRKNVESLMASCKDVTGDPEMDIGLTQAEGPVEETEELRSNYDMVVEQIHDVIGTEQVHRGDIQFAPSWIVEEAIETEVEDNWKDAYEIAQEDEIPPDANVISSHFVFKVKTDETGKKKLKARMCPHGNKDKMKGLIRFDASSARFDVIRMMLSIACLLGLISGCVDIKGAFLQSGPINRILYVRPPRELGLGSNVLWKLKKLPYGIAEAGRQWAKTIEDWMIREAGLERINGVSQLFLKRNNNGDISLLIAKITDDLLMAGRPSEMESFVEMLSKTFKTSKVIIGDEILFNGSRIIQDREGNVTMDMYDYIEQIRSIEISMERKNFKDDKATDQEIYEYRRLAGEMIWIGCSVLPQALVVGSTMQQRVPYLTVQDLIDGNRMLKEMRDLEPLVVFKKPPEIVKEMAVLTYSDAAFNISSRQTYGQTGIICGLWFGSDNKGTTYHPIDWCSSKQRRISHSSYGAEILACTDADDHGLNLKNAVRLILSNQTIRHVLTVDSKGLYDTISTLHDGRDYRLKQTVQRIRDSFESGDIDVLRWVQGSANIADGLTKRDANAHKMLNRILRTGSITLPKHRSFTLDRKTWS